MRAYLSILRLRFLLLLQYRMAGAAAITNYFFFGLVRIMVFDAFFRSSTASQPMSFGQTVTYQWLVQAMLFLQPWSGDPEVEDMVRSGDVAYELCRPVDLYSLWLSRCLAYRLAPTIIRAIPVVLMAAFLVPPEYRFRLPISPAAGVAWLVSTAGAVVLAGAFSVLYIIITLWTISGTGISRMMPMVVVMLSGSSIPISFFPDWLQPVLRFLPFSGMVDTPFRFYLGLLPAATLLPWLAHQLGWALALVMLGRWLLNRGLRRVVVQGG